MAKHAELGPSSAVRWMTCPGSVLLSRGQPEDQSEYAEEGTLAHAVAARALNEGKDAAAYIGLTTEQLEAPV